MRRTSISVFPFPAKNIHARAPGREPQILTLKSQRASPQGAGPSLESISWRRVYCVPTLSVGTTYVRIPPCETAPSAPKKKAPIARSLFTFNPGGTPFVSRGSESGRPTFASRPARQHPLPQRKRLRLLGAFLHLILAARRSCPEALSRDDLPSHPALRDSTLCPKEKGSDCSEPFYI